MIKITLFIISSKYPSKDSAPQPKAKPAPRILGYSYSYSYSYSHIQLIPQRISASRRQLGAIMRTTSSPEDQPLNDQSAPNHIHLLTQTATALKAARGNPDELLNCITRFFAQATAAGLDFDHIENLLGIDEPSIMDLAELSDADEELIISAFERFYGVEDESD